MKDEIIPISIKGILGVASGFGSAQLQLSGLSLSDLDLVLGIAAKVGGTVVAILTAISICFTLRRQWKQRHDAKKQDDTGPLNFLFVGILFLLIGCTAGCASSVKNEQKSEAVKATEAISTSSDRTTERTFEVTPAAALGVYQTAASNAAEVAVIQLPAVRETTRTTTSIQTGAGSRTDSQSESKSKWPLWITVIGIGIGLIVLAIGLRVLWNTVKTTSFGQGLAAADEIAARQIRKLRERAAISTDPSEQARLNLDIAELEAERGRNAAKLKR